MHPRLVALTAGVSLTGDVRADMVTLLTHHDQRGTVDHSLRVAEEARRLARRYGEDAHQAELAGWLHDISAVIPNAERAQAARELGLAVLPEEDAVPMILHQRLSAVIARELFDVSEAAVLSAIACHTTLKAHAARLDKVVFVADKVAWDQPGTLPYLDSVLGGLHVSLDDAVLGYLSYLWRRRETLPVLHPWFAEAYRQLAGV